MSVVCKCVSFSGQESRTFPAGDGVFRIAKVEVGDRAGKDRLQEDWNCIAAD